MLVSDRVPRFAARVIALAITLTACSSDAPLSPSRTLQGSVAGDATMAQQVRALALSRGFTPLPAPPHVTPELVRLGQALAFDPVLSGDERVACMTCHNVGYETGDARRLSIGEGGVGIGPDRTHPDGVNIPRNAPSLFNAWALRSLFWDGRVSMDGLGILHTPAGVQLTPRMRRALQYGAISAIGMFPVMNRHEMRGDNTNPMARLPDDAFAAVWTALMQRLGSIPEYRQMFEAAYPGQTFDEMTFANASNAMAAFFIDRFTFGNTPWDRFLAGDDGALTADQLEGAQLFLNLRCSQCHSGALLSDGQFHNVALAQFGPGEGDGASGHEDFGRFDVDHLPSHRYAYRTTPLRNVELTGPYGHAGQFTSLRAFIAHYSASDAALRAYDPTQLEPMLQGTFQNDIDAILSTRDPLLNGVVLTDDQVDRLTAYMQSLTDPAARSLADRAPARVPSGLPVGGG